MLAPDPCGSGAFVRHRPGPNRRTKPSTRLILLRIALDPARICGCTSLPRVDGVVELSM